MDAILGFAVLTGPMWLILLTLLIGIGIAVAVAKRLKQKSGKFVGIVGVFLILFLLLFGDEMAGKVYFNYLCATEAGVKVYQTAELPAEYWEADGKPKFYGEKNGNYYLAKEYPTELKIEKDYSIFYIDRLVTLLRDHNKEKIFSERTSFMYWGGWMRRNLSPSNTATSCGDDLEQYGKLIRQVFKPINSR